MQELVALPICHDFAARFSLRGAATASLFAMIILLPSSSFASEGASPEFRLRCTREAIEVDDHVACDITLFPGSLGKPLLVPLVLLPYTLETRPATLVDFEVVDGGGRVHLLSIERRGRAASIEVAPTMSRRDLFVLYPGSVVGWTFDIGEDWSLPTEPGHYLLRARLKVDLRAKSAAGQTYRGVAEAARDLRLPESQLLSGEWTTSAVPLEIKAPRSSTPRTE